MDGRDGSCGPAWLTTVHNIDLNSRIDVPPFFMPITLETQHLSKYTQLVCYHIRKSLASLGPDWGRPASKKCLMTVFEPDLFPLIQATIALELGNKELNKLHGWRLVWS